MDFAPFLDPLAATIVVGGTVVATILRTPARDLARALAALGTLARAPFDAAPLQVQIAAQARIAQRHGVVALDRSIIRDPDVAAAIADIVDGTGIAMVEEAIRRRRIARGERHAAAADVWAGIAEVAPAMGMVGTLVGLVTMFMSMTDPKTIGAAMAVALLATLYGALVANFIAAPIAARLRRAARIEAVGRAALDMPLVALAAREAPRALASAA